MADCVPALNLHCWHYTGKSSTLGMHPTCHEVRCCECNQKGYRQDEIVPMEGHGKYAPKVTKPGKVVIT